MVSCTGHGNQKQLVAKEQRGESSHVHGSDFSTWATGGAKPGEHLALTAATHCCQDRPDPDFILAADTHVAYFHVGLPDTILVIMEPLEPSGRGKALVPLGLHCQTQPGLRWSLETLPDAIVILGRTVSWERCPVLAAGMCPWYPRVPRNGTCFPFRPLLICSTCCFVD